ncbi:MAG: hypothetical protein C4301_08815, partial [Thermus sp.]
MGTFRRGGLEGAKGFLKGQGGQGQSGLGLRQGREAGGRLDHLREGQRGAQAFRGRGGLGGLGRGERL